MEPNSVKDRPVLSMIDEAMARGDISDETEVVEASSGNVAFALSSIMQVRLGRKPLVFISRMHGATKARAVRISGVPVILTSAEEGTASARRASLEYAAGRENVFHTNQHGNPDNPRAHRLTTGPEIYHQCHLLTGGPPAEFVSGVGSGGTCVGVAMFREDVGADFKVIGVEPDEASLLTGGGWSEHGYSGLAPGFITDIVARDREKLDGIERVTREEGYAICRRLLVEEGILAGASTGASISAALRRARLPENEGKAIVTMAHDRGDRYMKIEDLYVPPDSATETDVGDFFGGGDAAG
jgi:cysteine synthase A